MSLMRTILAVCLLVMGVSFSGCVTAPPRAPGVLAPGTGVWHVVESGATLWRISKTYGVDIDELMRVNRITDPASLTAGQRIFIPGAVRVLTVEPYRPLTGDAVAAVVGPRKHVCSWRTITLHHSATLEGNAASFDRNHRRRGMGGLFYHFVIGNGHGSCDGEIEVGWRWKKQVQVERCNDIQICLVGDFNRQQVSARQFDALSELVSVLCRQYGIKPSNIRSHKSLRGKKTECPGRNFPFDRLISRVRSSQR